MKSLSFNLITIVLLILSGFVSIITAQENSSNLIEMKQFLVAGPFAVKSPVMINVSADKYSAKDILEYNYKDKKNWWMQEGEKLFWDDKTSVEWESFEATGKDGILLDTEGNGYSLYYLATYINSKTYFEGKLNLSSNHLFEVYADGSKICSKSKADLEKPEKEDFVTGALFLEPGKHLIIIKTLYDFNSPLPWNMKVNLEGEGAFEKNLVSTSINPERRMTLKHLLDIPVITGVSLSSAGKYAAINYRQIKDSGEGYDYRVDVLNTQTGKVLFPNHAGQNISNLHWAPNSPEFSFTTTEGKTKSIHITNINSGVTKTVLQNVENLSEYRWSPDGTFIIYSITEKPEEDKDGLKKLQGMADRWHSWRDKDELYFLDIMNGTKRQLTKSEKSSELYDIHPDGDKILFGQTKADYKTRPYSKTVLYIMNLRSMKTDSILTSYWLNDASFSPDGEKLLVSGAPEMFDGIGNTLPDGTIPSGSETESYIYDLESGKAEAITKNFDPSIISAYWHQKNIYFAVTDKSKKQFFKYNINSKTFSKIDIEIEAIKKIAYAKNAPFAIYYGSSATKPQAVYFMDLQNGNVKQLANPSVEMFKYTKLSDVKRWTFKNKNNVEIEGRVYYPPDFDANKKYPCIVYYYGGVVPVERSFGGRYPKNFYSAHDYIVYVLQPSGCVGFGQEFSSLHVNDWGKIVADEIIDGVGKFLDAHPFVDRERVGCLGASYGGFMTMLLTTKTDIFAAAISHAGISDISGYWGEGFWGYWYNSISAANSFPWNRKDIYIDQSPLFGAENITTPLLLLHGDSDTNVPPGESRQLYTALTLLGKEVELIEVAGQDHWILEYNKRKKWTKTIIAWFDKWLKGDDSWWKELYKSN